MTPFAFYCTEIEMLPYIHKNSEHDFNEKHVFEEAFLGGRHTKPDLYISYV